jgi:hypothetical protein
MSAAPAVWTAVLPDSDLARPLKGNSCWWRASRGVCCAAPGATNAQVAQMRVKHIVARGDAPNLGREKPLSKLMVICLDSVSNESRAISTEHSK